MSVAFLNKNSREFSERYVSTYGLLDYKGKKRVVLVKGANTEMVSLSDKDGVSYQVNVVEDNPECVFHFFLPKTGWVNTTSFGPIRVARVPARQFKFGVCPQNTQFVAIDGGAMRMDFTTVEAAFMLTPPERPKLEIGVPWALSSTFALTKKGNVWAGIVNIGQVKESKMEFNAIENKQLFSQELMDAFRRNDLKVEV